MMASKLAAVDSPPRKAVAPYEASFCFLRDVAEVSGYRLRHGKHGQLLSGYSSYRPMLTAPDPWYFAALVALETCKICDLFPSKQSEPLLRTIFQNMDLMIGSDGHHVSSLAFAIMGRIGMAALLLNRKIPDDLLSKVMLTLSSSQPSGSFALAPGARKQIKSALSLGSPVWWIVFHRHYQLANHHPISDGDCRAALEDDVFPFSRGFHLARPGEISQRSP
jgi:hypothetical protein